MTGEATGAQPEQAVDTDQHAGCGCGNAGCGCGGGDGADMSARAASGDTAAALVDIGALAACEALTVLATARPELPAGEVVALLRGRLHATKDPGATAAAAEVASVWASSVLDAQQSGCCGSRPAAQEGQR